METSESTSSTAPASGGCTPRRYRPGAPPPAPPSKSKKKKTKSALKRLAASASDAGDMKAGKVDSSLSANPVPLSTNSADTGNNTGPKVGGKGTEKNLASEMVTRRIKALGKKAQRAKEYKDEPKWLNEDQKAVAAQLPSLEAMIKELEGAKKTAQAFERTQHQPQAQPYAEDLDRGAKIEGKDAVNGLVIDALTKRTKALGKKVQRANEYKSQTQLLNADQKALVARVPILEAAINELQKVKNLVERQAREQRPPEGLNATEYHDDSDEATPRGFNATDRYSDSDEAPPGGLNSTDHYNDLDEAPLAGLNATDHCHGLDEGVQQP